MIKMGAMAVLCAGLAGCMTPEKLAARDDTQCKSYGAAPGSAAYVNCRVQLESNRAAERAALLR